jgi:hypothetical protein
MTTNNVLPDFKAQCSSRSIAQEAHGPRTDPPSPPAAPVQYIRRQENADEPPAADLVAEAIRVTNSHLLDEELPRREPPPQETTVVRQRQEDAVLCVLKRNTAYWLLLFAVVLSAVFAGFCGAGKCSGTSGEASSSADNYRAAAIATFVNRISLSSEPIEYPPPNSSAATAEELALQWLIEQDPLSLPYSEQLRLQQRYALLTLWIETRLW